MPPDRKYAIHPDWVASINDNDVHYLNAEILMRLYGLRPHECLIIDDMKEGRRDYARLMKDAEIDNLIHLYPRFKGDYREYLEKVRKSK